MSTRWRLDGMLVALSLAFGVAAVTISVSVARDALVGSVPFAEPRELVWIGDASADQPDAGVAFSRIERLNATSRALEAAAGFTRRGVSVRALGADATEVQALAVTGSYFRVLRLSVGEGRGIEPADDRAGAGRVVVINRPVWERVLGETPPLGATLFVNDLPHEVVGVLDDDPRFPAENLALYTAAKPVLAALADVPNARVLWGIGRLASNASAIQLQSELDAIAAGQNDPEFAGHRPFAADLATHLNRDIWPRVLTLLWIAAFVAVLALTSAVNFLLGRHLAQMHATAVRLALGEPARHLIGRLARAHGREVGGGTLLGLGLAWGLLHVVQRWAPRDVPEFSSVPISGGSVGAAIALAIAAVGVMTVARARVSGRIPLATTLQASATVGRASRSQNRWRNALLVAEVAATFVLLVSALTLVNRYRHLSQAQLGFSPSGLMVTRISRPIVVLTPENRSQVTAYFARFLEIVAAEHPGLQVALTTDVPTEGNRFRSMMVQPGMVDSVPVGLVAASPNYLTLLGTELRAGRMLLPEDEQTAGDEAVVPAVIDSRVAERAFGDSDPIGATRLLVDLGMTVRVVGVTSEFRQQRVGESAVAQVIVPYNALALPWAAVVMRSEWSTGAARTALESAATRLDPNQRVAPVVELRDLVLDRLDRSRLYAVLLGISALLALLLTATGILGVVALRVQERQQELGVRAALGATPAGIFRLVVGHALSLATFGVIAGSLVAFGATSVLRSVLYGTNDLDPLTALACAGLVLLVTFIAAALPALRAARLSPTAAIRS